MSEVQRHRPGQDPFAALFKLPDQPLQSGLRAAEPLTDQQVLRQHRQLRPAELSRLLQRIDLYSDQRSLDEAVRWIASQYQVADLVLPVGLFSRCYLGGSWVDHRLDLFEEILEHYHADDYVPIPYAAARPLAQNPAYDYIEVYSDGSLIPIYPDGRAG